MMESLSSYKMYSKEMFLFSVNAFCDRKSNKCPIKAKVIMNIILFNLAIYAG